jgi:hypothetical protein
VGPFDWMRCRPDAAPFCACAECGLQRIAVEGKKQMDGALAAWAKIPHVSTATERDGRGQRQIEREGGR